ncbi:hypothetical protein OHV05_34930 [Kitasatospora sp. NBC_00070]|uniref:hypothetical protein n=1 Tax=Kitasatospora sp. NBC_00070 TaxID=2975962 RepID=UPI003248E1D9
MTQNHTRALAGLVVAAGLLAPAAGTAAAAVGDGHRERAAAHDAAVPVKQVLSAPARNALTRHLPATGPSKPSAAKAVTVPATLQPPAEKATTTAAARLAAPVRAATTGAGTATKAAGPVAVPEAVAAAPVPSPVASSVAVGTVPAAVPAAGVAPTGPNPALPAEPGTPHKPDAEPRKPRAGERFTQDAVPTSKRREEGTATFTLKQADGSAVTAGKVVFTAPAGIGISDVTCPTAAAKDIAPDAGSATCTTLAGSSATAYSVTYYVSDNSAFGLLQGRAELFAADGSSASVTTFNVNVPDSLGRLTQDAVPSTRRGQTGTADFTLKQLDGTAAYNTHRVVFTAPPGVVITDISPCEDRTHAKIIADDGSTATCMAATQSETWATAWTVTYRVDPDSAFGLLVGKAENTHGDGSIDSATTFNVNVPDPNAKPEPTPEPKPEPKPEPRPVPRPDPVTPVIHPHVNPDGETRDEGGSGDVGRLAETGAPIGASTGAGALLTAIGALLLHRFRKPDDAQDS